MYTHTGKETGDCKQAVYPWLSKLFHRSSLRYDFPFNETLLHASFANFAKYKRDSQTKIVNSTESICRKVLNKLHCISDPQAVILFSSAV